MKLLNSGFLIFVFYILFTVWAVYLHLELHYCRWSNGKMRFDTLFLDNDILWLELRMAFLKWKMDLY
jgi:hypothetical protein